MTCSEFEILLSDYVDGTATAAERSSVEQHVDTCFQCRELFQDVFEGVAYLEKAGPVVVPSELITRLVYQAPQGRVRPETATPGLWQRWFKQWGQPVLQPRFAMSMAMTILSFAMLGRCAGVHVQQVRAADLNPLLVWNNLEDKCYRAWDRTAKYYDNLRLVYEVETRWLDMRNEGEPDRKAAPAVVPKTGSLKTDDGQDKRGRKAMNCYKHPELASEAFCRTCGRGLCGACRRNAVGTVFCEEHFPVDAGPNPYAQPNAPYGQTAYSQPGMRAATGASPGLAFLLGLIPGVGAVYNGQYAKGFIHVAVLGVLISILGGNHFAGSGMEPLFGMLIAIWYFYMPFEAYHTARKKELGIAVDEWSSLLPNDAARPASLRGKLPLGPLILIAIGVLFLLDNLGWLRMGDILRFWPLILIALGVASLYSRLARPAVPEAVNYNAPRPEGGADAGPVGVSK